MLLPPGAGVPEPGSPVSDVEFDGAVPAASGPAPAVNGEVVWNDALVSRMAVGKVYRHHKAATTGLDFTYDGSHLVTCGQDNSVFVYNCERAERTRHLRCEKYGCSLIRFLHNDKDGAISASSYKGDQLLKYWDFHENKYLRLFKGHGGPVSSLSPHPYEDIFLTGSEDATVMLWDLRAEKPTAKINGQGPTVARFDQQGMVFAACVGRPKIHLFDTRNFAQGEFTCFDLSPHIRDDALPVSVQFSPCGKYLLLRTAQQLLLVDAFDGQLSCEYPVAGLVQGERIPEPSFSPDSKYVMCGVPGGDTCVWGTSDAKLVKRLTGHTATPTYATFSPVHSLAVTAAETLAWWIPDVSSS